MIGFLHAALLSVLSLLFPVSPAPAIINSVGKTLPSDAAPPEQQVFRYMTVEPLTYDVGIALYGAMDARALFERLAMLDENLDIVPAAATRWETVFDILK